MPSTGDQQPTDAPAPSRLYDWPDHAYLLRDFDAIYRQGSAGGSRAIRSHMRHVRERISELIDANPPIVERPPERKPVVSHLPRALDLGSRGALSVLARTVERLTPHLTWEYGYPRMPRRLADRYAYAEIVGPQGPVLAERIILGLVLFAPGTTYPQHHHRGIEESYVSIAGAWSENDAAVYAPGSLILNRSEHEHRITTGLYEPCLLAYAWVGAPDRLADPEMTFTPPRRR